MEEEHLLEKYENLEQHDFLSMSRKEWEEFIDYVARVVLRLPVDWTRIEVFLAERGLYIFLDLAYFRYATPSLSKKLYEIAIDFAEKVANMEVIAAVQPPSFGQSGYGYVYPEEKEQELTKLIERSETFEELALRLMRRYGPCILIDADDDVDYALLCCVPRVTSGQHE
jgi:hypothetical protein